MWQGREYGSVTIGQELAGTTGAAAPMALFLYNRLFEQIGGQGGHFENVDSSVSENAPPYGGWLATPPTSDNGGSFFTQCCLPLNSARSLASSADSATTPQRLEIPSTPTVAQTPVSGVRAIQPTLTGRIPAFREADVREFAMRFPPPKTFTDASSKSIANLDCGMFSQDLAAHLGNLTTALSSDLPICYVELSGNFVVSVPPAANGQNRNPRLYVKAFEVFDARTGNMLLSGVLP